jgi:hypothetical protein
MIGLAGGVLKRLGLTKLLLFKFNFGLEWIDSFQSQQLLDELGGRC